jgi:hypothetical protein
VKGETVLDALKADDKEDNELDRDETSELEVLLALLYGAIILAISPLLASQ